MSTRSCPKCSLLMKRCDFKFCPDCGAQLDSPSDATTCCASFGDNSDCGANTPQEAVARVPHPWKKGHTRNVYEFPVTRKIIIEADPNIPATKILAMAKRCHDKEIGLDIMGGGYQITLSPPNA